MQKNVLLSAVSVVALSLLCSCGTKNEGPEVKREQVATEQKQESKEVAQAEGGTASVTEAQQAAPTMELAQAEASATPVQAPVEAQAAPATAEQKA